MPHSPAEPAETSPDGASRRGSGPVPASAAAAGAPPVPAPSTPYAPASAAPAAYAPAYAPPLGHVPAVPVPPVPVSAAPRRKVPARLLIMVPAMVIGGLAGSGHLPGLPSPDAGMAAVLGMLVGLNLTMLTLRVLGPWAGMAVVWSSVGIGRWLGSAAPGGRLVVFRMLPLIPFSACLVIRERPGLRWRLWSVTACCVLVEAAVAAALLAAGGGAAHVGLGAAAVSVFQFLVRPGRVTSRFWLLFRLPMAGQEERLAEWINDEASVTAARRMAAGQLPQARQALDAAADAPAGPRRRAVGAALAVAEGRYDEGAREAYALVGEAQAPQLRLATLQTYAAALGDGALAGHWPREEALPRFAAVVAAIRAESPALLRVSDLGALDALLHGQPDRAVRLARSAAAIAPEALSRARALSTLGYAQAARGRHGQAASSFTRAEALAPGLARLPRRA